MSEKLLEIIRINRRLRPTDVALELMVYFRSQADECGLYSKVAVMDGVTDTDEDDLYLGASLVVDFSKPQAFLESYVSVCPNKLRDKVAGMITDINNRLEAGRCYQENHAIFYEISIDLDGVLSSKALEHKAAEVMNDFNSDMEKLLEFRDDMYSFVIAS